MFGSRSGETRDEAIRVGIAAPTSILASNLHIEGLLTGDGIVRIEGSYAGTIRHEGHLVIAKEAVVKASVGGSDVTVYGELEGDVNVTGKLELMATAKVTGTVKARRLAISEGAILTGECDVARPDPEGDGSAPKRSEGKLSAAL